VVVLHNKEQASLLGGQTALLAGGWIHEFQPTEDFFNAPQSQAGKDYVQTGSCSVPAPDTPEEYLQPEALEIIKERPELPVAAREYKSDVFGPRNFLWLQKGALAGTPRPGLVMDLNYDLEALQRVGISVLVSLTQIPIAVEELQKYQIQGIAFPIQDMGIPDIPATISLCAEVEKLLKQGESIAFHCRAGMGRTGTMLALQLIWQGYSALDALDTVRRTEPRWVQSVTQVSFLDEFEQKLKIA
jgi:atypical dual specificity phosphatase